MSIFCGRRWWTGNSRPRLRPTRCKHRLHYFLSSSLELWNQSMLEYQPVVLANSFLSRTNSQWTSGLENWSKKCEWKDEAAEQQWRTWTIVKKKRMEWSQTGLQSSTDRSILSCLSRLPRWLFKPRDLSGAVVQTVLNGIQYNVHYGKRQGGHLLRALRLENCTAAIIFPHNKIAQKITE